MTDAASTEQSTIEIVLEYVTVDDWAPIKAELEEKSGDAEFVKVDEAGGCLGG